MESCCEMFRSPYSLGVALLRMTVYRVSGGGCAGVGFGGPFLLIAHPPDPSHWPCKEADGAPGIAPNSRWLLAV